MAAAPDGHQENPTSIHGPGLGPDLRHWHGKLRKTGRDFTIGPEKKKFPNQKTTQKPEEVMKLFSPRVTASAAHKACLFGAFFQALVK